MAKAATMTVKMLSTAGTGFFYVKKRNPRKQPEKMEMRKYDPVARKHVAFKEAKTVKGQPTAIIAKTVKGKGVSYMENQAGWHGKAPNDEQYEIAMEDLEKAGEALCQM